MIGALFDGAMIPVKVAFGAAKELPQPTNEHVARTIQLLEKADQLARRHAPGNPPAFDSQAALWAARALQVACVRLVDKIEMDVDLPDDLAKTEPDGLSAAQHWSVDLVFRSSWDLIKRAATKNEGDPLNATLMGIAFRWPLAAVGTPAGVVDERMSVIWDHACLRQVYIFNASDGRSRKTP